LNSTDIHLVLEYKAGEKYAGYTAPRSNRFYVNADTYNPQLYGLTDLKPQEVDLVVIGGVQLLVVDDELKGRVEQIKDFHRSMQVDHHKKVHFELADIRDRGFHEHLSGVLNETDSLGLNEQELMHQLQFLKGGDIHDSNSRPTAQQLVDTINALLKLYRERGYKLSRLHLHSVKLQVICSTAAWSTPVIPTARSAIVATQLACNSTDIQSAEVHWEQQEFSTGRGSITLNDEHPVQTWETEGFTCAAALVPYCVEAKRTKSLGDNISGVGLAYHSLVTEA
jgi:ADP-dependent phosphofructokinase/glucokinase